MRQDRQPTEAAKRRALIRSPTMTRGVIGAALWIAGALVFTLLVSAFLQYLAVVRNERAGASEPWPRNAVQNPERP